MLLRSAARTTSQNIQTQDTMGHALNGVTLSLRATNGSAMSLVAGSAAIRHGVSLRGAAEAISNWGRSWDRWRTLLPVLRLLRLTASASQ